MNIAIWGLGKNGHEALDILKKNNIIVALGDLDETKKGTSIDGYEIYAIDDFLKNSNEAEIILMSMSNWGSAFDLLWKECHVDLDRLFVWQEKSIVKWSEAYAIGMYSLDGEEAFLREVFRNKKEGVYVDVGALHPYRFSNTAWAYNEGWRGINIEPNPDNFRLFSSVRVDDININCGISRSGGPLKYYKFVEPALNTFLEDVKEKRISEGVEFVGEELIPTYSLAEVFEKYGYKHIDFVDIDVECYEMEVIQSIDFDAVEIDYILVEQLGMTLESVLSSDIAEYLKQQGYVAVSKYNRTVIYKRN